MGVASGLIASKYNSSGLIINKAVILKSKTNSNIINKNKKTINNSSGLLSNKMLNRFESNGKAIIYSLKN